MVPQMLKELNDSDRSLCGGGRAIQDALPVSRWKGSNDRRQRYGAKD